jgi:RNA polymerase sigma-70 factor (ECF subfamily)
MTTSHVAPHSDLLAHLLTEARWARRLARALLREPDLADDLVQEAYLAALRRPPAPGASRRGWLTEVLRNRARSEGRAAARRARRERAAEAAPPVVPTPEACLERVELLRALAALVNELPEPERQVVVLRYFEDLSSAAIARRLSIPAGTVRWRLKAGLDTLRARLDAAHAGDRRAWRRALAPLGAAGPAGGSATAGIAARTLARAGLAGGRAKWAAAVCVLLLALLGAGRLRPGADGPASGRGGAGAGAAEGPQADAEREPSAGGRRERAPKEARRGAPPLFVAPTGADPGAADGGSGEARAAAPLESPDESDGGPPGDGQLPAWFGQPGVRRARIAGRVLFEGRPVAGAEVSLDSPLSVAAPARFGRRRVSDAAGRFDFGAWPAWGYVVSASAAGRAPAVRFLRTGDPTMRPPADELELVLTRCGAAVTGLVRDESGRGVPDVRVRAGTGELYGRGVETDERGGFAICPPDGAKHLRVEADGYGARIVALAPGGPPVEIALAPEAILEGRVVDASGGAPIPGAHLNVVPIGRDASGPGAVMAMADAAGGFRVEGLAAGAYGVNAWSADHVARDRTDVELRAGEIRRGFLRRVHPTGVVRGRVARGGHPVAGVVVRVELLAAEGSSRGAVTQADGTFALSGALPGASRVWVSGHEVRAPLRLDVAPGQAQPVLVEVVESADRATPAR